MDLMTKIVVKIGVGHKLCTFEFINKILMILKSDKHLKYCDTFQFKLNTFLFFFTTR